MPKRKSKKARLSVTISAAQKVALNSIAARNEVSLARVIQEAVKEFLSTQNDRRLSIFERPPPKGWSRAVRT
jgi:hypothetical protein